MKHYLIFAALGPLLGGFLMLIVLPTARATGPRPISVRSSSCSWCSPSTVQYGYLFGLVPVLMIAAVDDILSHVRRIGWVARMVLVGVLGFCRRGTDFGSRASDAGVAQFILYGLVGLVPAMLSSFLAAHKYAEPKTSAA